MTHKIAILVFNLGGPDRPEAIKPFLFNLFYDPLIIGLPNPFRYFLARLISSKRVKEATEIYEKIGGKSPILENTIAQAEAIEKGLLDKGQKDVKVFTAMRYWHPFATQVAQDIKDYDPNEIIILPLYPQWSTTTSQSFLRVWEKAKKIIGLKVPEKVICCYPTDQGFLKQSIENIIKIYPKTKEHGKAVLLLSAHGLPEKIVKKGDPYQEQCEMTGHAIIEKLEDTLSEKVDFEICYQSRVGPLKWIGPSTDDCIEKYAAEGRPILIYPIAFVSEHSETLVEINDEYRHLAKEKGAPFFDYIPTVSHSKHFIKGLVDLLLDKINMPVNEKNQQKLVTSQICTKGSKCCAHNLNQRW